MSKRKSMSGVGKGIGAFFDESEEAEEPKQQDDTSTSQHTDTQAAGQEAPDLKRATFYIRPDQNITIEEIKLQLTKRRINTNKSELVREAIDLLAEQDLEVLADRLAHEDKQS